MAKYVVTKTLSNESNAAEQVETSSYAEAVKIANGMLRKSSEEYGHPWGEVKHNHESDEYAWGIHSELQLINPDKRQTEGTFIYTYTSIEGLEDELEHYDTGYIIAEYADSETVSVSIKGPKQT